MPVLGRFAAFAAALFSLGFFATVAVLPGSAEAQESAERIQRDAVASVEYELRRAQDALREEAATLATELAGQILSQQVGDSDRDRLMDEFISRVESAAGRAGGDYA